MNEEMIFQRGDVAAAYFTGTAYVNMLVSDANNMYNCQVYDVLFEPSCRNNWHTHEGGQLLLCTSGSGYYQERGNKARRLKKGDVVEIPPHVEHWHGAAPDCSFTHVGISPNTQKGGATWLEPVTDEEYQEATSS